MKRLRSLVCVMMAWLMVFSLGGVGFTALTAEETTGSVDSSLVGVGIVNFDAFTDVKGHWAENVLRIAVEQGLMVGTSGTTMSPNGTLTRAELVTLLQRAFGATKRADLGRFYDIPNKAWYRDTVAKAVQMGIAEGYNNMFNPEGIVTRQEIVTTIYKACLYDNIDTKEAAKFSDWKDVADWAQPAMAAMVNNGIIKSTGGTLRPTDTATRAEFAEMVVNMASAYITPRANFTGTSHKGSLVIAKGDVTISNCSIDGNVFIAEGTETAPVKLVNTSISGTVYIRGGGTKGINFSQGSSAARIVVNNNYNAVDIITDDKSSIGEVIVTSANSGVSLEGTFKKVNMNTAKAPLDLKEAKVELLNVNKALAIVHVDVKSAIKAFNINEDADGYIVEDGGIHEKVIIDASEGKYIASGEIEELSFGKETALNKLNIEKKTELGTVKLNGDSQEIEILGAIGALVVEPESVDCKVLLKDGGVITKLQMDGPGVYVESDTKSSISEIVVNCYMEDFILFGDISSVTLTDKAEKSKVSFSDPANVAKVTVNSDDSTILIPAGVTVNEMIVNSKGVNISGAGTLVQVTTTNKSDDVVISVPRAKVINQSVGNVTAGGAKVGANTTVTINADGKGWVDSNGKPSNNTGGSGTTNLTSEFSVVFPSSAQPSDFGYESKYSKASFGDNLAITGNTIVGTVKAIADFEAFPSDGTGYYFPLLLDVADLPYNFRLTAGQKTYMHDDLSSGSNYANKLIFYLQLDPTGVTNTISVTFKADEYEAGCTPKTITIDTSSVVFEGASATNRIESTNVGTNGSGGTVTINSSDSDIADGKTTITLELASAGVAKSTYNSTNSYWTTLNIRKPNGAHSADYSIKHVDGSTQNGTSVITGDYLTNYTDISRTTAVDELVWVDVVWRNSGGGVIGLPERWKFDFTNVIRTGEVVTRYICDFVSISGLAQGDSWLSTNHSLSAGDLPTSVNVSGADGNGVIAGNLFQLTGHGTLDNGYYIPIQIDAYGLNGSADVSVNSSSVGTITPNGDGVDTAKALIKVVPTGSKFADLTITIGDSAGSSTAVTYPVSMAQCLAVDGGIAALNGAPGLLTGYSNGALSYKSYGSLLSVSGSLVKKTSISVPGVTSTNTTGWYLPVSLKLFDTGTYGDWTIEVRDYSGAMFSEYTKSDFAGKKTIDLLVPAGYSGGADTIMPSAVVVLIDELGTEVGYVLVSMTSVVCE